jgi:tetratricopeptide (TPR) repeat protein
MDDTGSRREAAPDPRRHRELQRHFDAAVDLGADERDAYVAALAGDDPELSARLARLIELDAKPAPSASAAELIAATFSDRDARNTPVIGDFRVVARLGAGGMGEVFLGERQRGEVLQRAAIKLIHRGLINADAERRFATEQIALARLEHPGIARWLDAGRLGDGTPWYAMEYIDGEPLTTFCDARRLDIAARVALFVDVCRSVEFAHAQLVLHRDLKPGNILVDTGGRPRLLDFGIARLIRADGDVEPTATSGGFVSAHYSAPEMYDGAGGSLRTDVYSLCAMLYELLCGAPPLQRGDESHAAFETRVRHQMPPPPSARATSAVQPLAVAQARGLQNADALAARLRGDLDQIALHGLRKQPGERYGSVTQLIDDLERWRLGEPVLARGAGRGYRMRKFLRRHWALSALAATLAVTVVAAVIVLGLQARQLARERDVAEQERDRAQYAVTVLREAFIAADPAQADGDARVRDVLDAARQRLDALALPQPLLFAELAGSIGEVEIAIGLDERAAVTLARAAERAAVGGMAPEGVQRLRARSAWALVAANDFESAASALAAAAPPVAANAAVWHAAQGKLQRALGEFEEAEASARRAVAALPDDVGDEVIALQIRNLLVDTMRSLGDHARALAEVDRILAWQQSLGDANAAALLRTRQHRVDLLRRVGSLEDALAEASDISARTDAIYGADSVFAATASSSVASVLTQTKRYPEAAALYRKAHAAYRRAFGDHHVSTVRTRFNVALVSSHVDGAHEEAEREFQGAIADTDALGEAGAGGSVYYRSSYAEHLLRTGRPDAALALLADAGAAGRLAHARGRGGKFYREALARTLAAVRCDGANAELCRNAHALSAGAGTDDLATRAR